MNTHLRLCKIRDCAEPRLGRSCFCMRHHRDYNRRLYRRHKTEHAQWVEERRKAIINGLLAASTPDEQVAIERGRAEGRKLRELAEVL